MRALTVSVVISTSCAALTVQALAEESALKGKVSESSIKLLSRPEQEIPKAVPLSRTPAGGQSKRSFSLDSSDFDLDGQKKEIDLGISKGNTTEKIQDSSSDGLGCYFGPPSISSPFLTSKTAPSPAETFNPNLLPPGFSVCARIQPSAMQYINEDAHLWHILLAEMHPARVQGAMPGTLYKQWGAWQWEVAALVQRHSIEIPRRGIALVHMVVMPDGTLASAKPYNGSKHPFPGLAPSEANNQDLLKTIQGLRRFPHFPSGSKAELCPVLVCVANN